MAQATKKRIMDGFLELLEQRPLDKISVVDIADHCGINRNTFYYYYCDVYALIRELMEVRAQQLITDNQEDLNWIEITREVTSFFRTHRRTVYHLFHSSQRDLLEDHIYDVTYACTESLVRRTAAGLSVSEADLRAVTLFFTSSLLGMISRWLRFGMKDDAEQLGERTGVLLEGTLRRMLERACGTGEGRMRGFWIAVAYLLVLAALAHPLGQALPRRWFDGGRFPYRCYKWEKQGKLYTRIGIERWKKLVPDMSRFLPDMVKKEVDPAAVTASQVELLVQETCVAEAVHTASILLGLGALWLCPGWGGVVLWLIWFLLANLPFILIQRYNRPRLMRLHALLQRREQRKGTHEHSDTDL